MKKTSIAVAVALLAPIPLASTAFADRPPTASERQKLTKILRSNGFVSWKKIERDDGKWEVDDAVTRTGKVYDIDIRGGRIVSWDRD
jgi:hypothetical protein